MKRRVKAKLKHKGRPCIEIDIQPDTNIKDGRISGVSPPKTLNIIPSVYIYMASRYLKMNKTSWTCSIVLSRTTFTFFFSDEVQI